MNRKQRIFNFLEEISYQYPEGVTTIFIAEHLNLSRANVSNELNILVKEHMVKKSVGRPVRYFTKRVSAIHNESNEQEDPFSYLIGYHHSLENAVKQAKAAILYPPFGLHTLITGSTGVGKSLFAKLMFNYAIYNHRIATLKPFIVFNCADYANNPQLLISHIFGYVKGAFTGAVSEKLGLIAEADGGMLFLDEIHRLPPEGQEMIFYFIDTGTYGLLGETQRKRKSQVLLVCATTEDPDSALLATFLRRIPIKINLPDLAKRTPEELIDLLNFIFENESQRIKHSISIDKNSAKAILGASFSGNVGKLKSTIQTVCALTLVDHGTKDNMLIVKFEHLPAEIKSGLFNFKRDKEYQFRLSQKLQNGLLIQYNQDSNSIFNSMEYDNPMELDSFINNKIQFMLDNQFSEQEMNHFLTSEVRQYEGLSSQILQDHGIDNEIMQFCQQIKSELELQLGCYFSQGFIYSLAFHIDNIMNKNNIITPKEWVKKYHVNHFETYNSALLIQKRLQTVFNLTIDDDEVAYLAILISSLKVCKSQHPIHVIVAAHGNSIASEMVKIATELLAENNISSVDMPLNIQPNQAILQIKKAVSALQNVQGILLLVDMGSLKQAETVIASDCDIPIRTLDMVSTPLVIEALRRSVLLNIELDELYLSLKHFRGYSDNSTEDTPQLTNVQKPYAILTICSSGEGIAKKLKNFLQLMLEKIDRKDIFVLNISVDNLLHNKANILMEYNLLATIGVIDPELKVPHLFLDELFSYKGDFLLQTIIGSNNKQFENNKLSKTITTLAEVYLQDFLVYLNPYKILPIVGEFIATIKEARPLNNIDAILLNAYIHISCALERSLKQESIEYNKNASFQYSTDIITSYQKAAFCFKAKLGIELDDNELFYIIDMLEKK